MNGKIKNILFSDKGLSRLAIRIINRFSGNSRSALKIKPQSVLMRSVKYSNRGENNSVTIGAHSLLNGCRFFVSGNRNRIEIGEGCRLNNLTICIEDDENTVIIGEGTTVSGDTELACIEGCTLSVGSDCMFSGNISLRTGDSHVIVNDEGERINPSKDITIGNHVWLCQRAFVGKGAVIGAGSIIGASAVVTKPFPQSNIAVAGNPARIVKENINWKRERG